MHDLYLTIRVDDLGHTRRDFLQKGYPLCLELLTPGGVHGHVHLKIRRG